MDSESDQPFQLWQDAWIYPAIFISRIVLCGILDFYIYFNLRKDYRIAQRVLKKGWGSFTGVCVLFYALLIVASAYPSMIWDRPQELPTYVLLLIIIPFVLYSMLYTLTRQMQHHLADAHQRIMQIQLDSMRRQTENMLENEARMRIYHHDIRHYVNQLIGLLQTEDYAAAHDVLTQLAHQSDKMQNHRYCENSVVNAMISYYIQLAESHGINVDANLNIPADISIDAIDLSTVLANALENACNALKKLPQAERLLRLRCVCSNGQFLLSVENAFRGTVRFDERGLPISNENGHGIGSQSIAVFAEKYAATWDYQAENGIFRLRLLARLPAAACDADVAAASNA